MKQCSHCIFWFDSGKHNKGECRKEPPKILLAEINYKTSQSGEMRIVQQWPMTDAYKDWCGQFISLELK